MHFKKIEERTIKTLSGNKRQNLFNLSAVVYVPLLGIFSLGANFPCNS